MIRLFIDKKYFPPQVQQETGVSYQEVGQLVMM